MAEEKILARQIIFLKKKLTDFLRKHKLIVGSLKQRYQIQLTKLMKIGVRYKTVAKTLKKKLELEKERAARVVAESRSEIVYLQNELQRERAKVLQAETLQRLSEDKKHEQVDRNQEELDLLKDANYAKAQVDSLRQELKNEIAKSAKIAANADAKIVVLEEELTTIKEQSKQNEAKLLQKLSQYDENKQKEFKDITKENSDLKEQYQKLTQDNEVKQKDIENKHSKIVQLTTDLKKANDTIESLNQKSKEDHQKFKIICDQQDLEMTKLNKHINGLKNHSQKLFELTRTYDIFQIYDSINKLKRKVEIGVKTPEREKMKNLLLQVEEQNRVVRLYEKKVMERLANFDNEIHELKEKVTNNVYKHEDVFKIELDQMAKKEADTIASKNNQEERVRSEADMVEEVD